MVGGKVYGQILSGTRSEKPKILFVTRDEKRKNVFGTKWQFRKILFASRRVNTFRIASISASTYMKHARELLQPTIYKVWREEQEEYFHQLTSLDEGL